LDSRTTRYPSRFSIQPGYGIGIERCAHDRGSLDLFGAKGIHVRPTGDDYANAPTGAGQNNDYSELIAGRRAEIETKAQTDYGFGVVGISAILITASSAELPARLEGRCRSLRCEV